MSELEQLRAELEIARQVMTAMEWEHVRLKFHGFDAIQNDSCPCCNARVSVIDNGHGSGLKLQGENVRSEEWAWAAGLFEGEGSISFRGKSSVHLRLAMTDFDAVQKFQSVVAVGYLNKVSKHYTRPNAKDQMLWQLERKDDVRAVLKKFMPWLLERRRKRAKEALARLEGNRGTSADRTHCPKGHPLSGANLFINNAGRRCCRSCTRDSGRRYRERLEEKTGLRYRKDLAA